jgi:hypothetical protein
MPTANHNRIIGRIWHNVSFLFYQSGFLYLKTYLLKI